MSRYACGYVLDFAEGEAEEQVLHVGTLAECEQIAALLPGVAYSGPRKCTGARFVIVPVEAGGGDQPERKAAPFPGCTFGVLLMVVFWSTALAAARWC